MKFTKESITSTIRNLFRKIQNVFHTSIFWSNHESETEEVCFKHKAPESRKQKIIQNCHAKPQIDQSVHEKRKIIQVYIPRSECVMDESQKKERTSCSNAWSFLQGKKALLFAFLVVLLLNVIVLLLLQGSKENEKTEGTTSRPKSTYAIDLKPVIVNRAERTAHLRAEIERSLKKYVDKNHALLLTFQNDSNRCIRRNYRIARSAVSSCVEKVSGLSACVKLAYKASKDKITGSEDFNATFRSIVDEPIGNPCVQAHSQTNDLLKNLDQRMRENYFEFLSELASFQKIESICTDLEEEDLQELSDGLNLGKLKAKELHLQKICAYICTGIELAFLRQTVNLAISVLSPIIAKISGTASAASICAIADGPLPFGDSIALVLGVGGLVWTGYDIYQVANVLPDELRSELNNGIQKSEQTLRSDSRTMSENLLLAYDDAGTKLCEQLCNQLKGE